jgi:carbamoyl-phosphate synthase/aspartate carbamoyltransferase/dihydroorotase
LYLSLTEGISIPDSIAVMAGYADVVVLRHPEPGAVSVSAVSVDVNP